MLFFQIKRLSFFLLLSLTLFILFSCARLPQGIQIPEPGAERVKISFQDFLTTENNCSQCLDARLVIFLKSTFFKGSLEGYLKIQAADNMKYVALNPIGQTQAILVTDGDDFHFLSLPDRKSYLGKVETAVGPSEDYPYAKYIPAGFPFERSFFLFTGRIFPGPVEIEQVTKADNEEGYWLEVKSPASGRALILFDDINQVVKQYISLDQKGKENLKIVYENYQYGTGCKLPGLIFINSREQKADIRLRLSEWRESSCYEDDFYFETPRSFEKVVYN